MPSGSFETVLFGEPCTLLRERGGLLEFAVDKSVLGLLAEALVFLGLAGEPLDFFRSDGRVGLHEGDAQQRAVDGGDVWCSRN